MNDNDILFNAVLLESFAKDELDIKTKNLIELRLADDLKLGEELELIYIKLERQYGDRYL